MFRLICTIALLVYTAAAQQPPHLSQAWTAMSTGDGLPNKVGQESYLYEGCKERSETCMNGHIFNYGEKTCVKYEIDQGGKSRLSGTFYVSCDGGLDCCMKVKSGPERIPKVKKWDIGMAGGVLWQDHITYLGKKDTTELNNKPVTGADTWLETFTIPFTKAKVNYTYYVTTNGTDIITHRINFGANAKGGVGSILYGDFQPQHNITAFRSLFTPPAACLSPHVMQCPKEKVEEWEETYFN